MINKNEFKYMRKEMKKLDEQRERLIRKSREIITFSKQIIHSIHRNEEAEASNLIKKIKKSLREMKRITSTFPELRYSAIFRDACQEYVEALSYFHIIKNNKLPTKKELGVDTESYLLGICDLTGELVRNAINSAIKEDFDRAKQIKDFVTELYGELLGFDFKNHLRRKFDSIKYDLKKLEDLMFSLKMRER